LTKASPPNASMARPTSTTTCSIAAEHDTTHDTHCEISTSGHQCLGWRPDLLHELALLRREAGHRGSQARAVVFIGRCFRRLLGPLWAAERVEGGLLGSRQPSERRAGRVLLQRFVPAHRDPFLLSPLRRGRPPL